MNKYRQFLFILFAFCILGVGFSKAKILDWVINELKQVKEDFPQFQSDANSLLRSINAKRCPTERRLLCFVGKVERSCNNEKAKQKLNVVVRKIRENTQTLKQEILNQ